MVFRRLICVALFATPAFADFNRVVLEQIRGMPTGGGYATDLEAHKNLAGAVEVKQAMRIQPEKARPGYCSGATYLVFLKTLGALQHDGQLSLPPQVWRELVPRLRLDGQDTLPDGESAWGRWNANGPGTARLFHELGLGPNFTAWRDARPGDFLKIFWTDAVGKSERGHSVIFLGTETANGVEQVRFWSSNQPEGFGEKSVPRSKIAHAIFSRLEHPERMARILDLPVRDVYLASLLTTASSFEEAKAKSGIP